MPIREISLASTLLALSLATVAAPAAPPVAPVHDVTQVLHGVTVHDPYRDFEDIKSPATQDWLKAQGAYAEGMLSTMPDRQALTERIDRELDELSRTLPEGLRLERDVFRQADFIEVAVENVLAALRDGVALVLLIVLLGVGSTVGRVDQGCDFLP